MKLELITSDLDFFQTETEPNRAQFTSSTQMGHLVYLAEKVRFPEVDKYAITRQIFHNIITFSN